ncbi:MAG: addiction module protein [Chlorobi bacterium]|nr:addiction module protein [Chlorobiota bacterium]
MNSKSLFKEALNLRPVERLQLMEWIAQSLDRPDEKIDSVWTEESEKRAKALYAGKVNTFSLNEIIERYK